MIVSALTICQIQGPTTISSTKTPQIPSSVLIQILTFFFSFCLILRVRSPWEIPLTCYVDCTQLSHLISKNICLEPISLEQRIKPLLFPVKNYTLIRSQGCCKPKLLYCLIQTQMNFQNSKASPLFIISMCVVINFLQTNRV